MEEERLEFIKKLFNATEIVEIRTVNSKSILIELSTGVRVYIDSTQAGLDFSVTAKTLEAEQFLDELESST